ncbi:MAG: methionyl-tRNA formyltransferase [Firmicutes bacterium]|nr:methionyl-tRNA formyltransferase [Bacillota bacterium]
MRLVFMGTPEFAVPSLKALIAQGLEIQAVVTQPDRARGRGQKVSYSPVKKIALEAGIPILQPKKVSDLGFIQELKELCPDAIVVVAFGQLIPPAIIHMPPHGCINVHASLLPAYRGASPIQRAIIDGCDKTGITTMLIDEGCDTGDILLQESVKIAPEDTAETLEQELAIVGASLLIETLERLKAKDLKPQRQDDAKASFAPKLTKASGELNWEMRAEDLANLVRGVNPWPGAYTYHRGQLLKVWEMSLTAGNTCEAPGTILGVTDAGILVAASQGEIVSLDVVQPANRPRMGGRDYANGYRVENGEVLGGLNP